MSIGHEAYRAMQGKVYAPQDSFIPESLSPNKHYIAVVDAPLCFGKDVRQLFRIEMIEKMKFGGWFSIRLTEPVSFDKLGFYVEVPEKDLPWNNGEELNGRRYQANS